MLQDRLPVSADGVVWALQGICQLHRWPFAPKLVLQQVPPPYTLLELTRAGRSLGLKSGVREVSAEALAKLPLPCIAVMKPVGDGPTSSAQKAAEPVVESKRGATRTPSPSQRKRREGDTASVVGATEDLGAPHSEPYPLALIARIDEGRIAFFEQGKSEPEVVTVAEFGARYAGEVVLFAPAARDLPPDPDTQSEAPKRFGFRWFIPELVRHKKIWRDVLLASLTIQLMALGTPIFTQIVIDKVIVHHTLNTLIVIAVALGVFLAFTAAMSWVRQYLVLHTGNRIDAVLATQVFEHLFKLPLRYFEHRPTGVLIARVHGVETIREFIASAAVTLMLDVPFLAIFLAVMFYYSVPLTLITLSVLAAIAGLSALVTPLFRERLNHQFLAGARNQAFLTEYVAGMETVKSLQMEPQLKQRFGEYLAAYLRTGFATRQLANTYNTVASALEQLLALMILCVGAWMVMTSEALTIGMLVAFQMFASRLSQPMLRMVGLWQQFQQAAIAVKRLGDVMNAPAEP